MYEDPSSAEKTSSVSSSDAGGTKGTQTLSAEKTSSASSSDAGGAKAPQAITGDDKSKEVKNREQPSSSTVGSRHHSSPIKTPKSELAEKDAPMGPTPKKRAKPDDDELSPEKTSKFARPDGFGGKVSKSDLCACCELPRTSLQRSGACEHCLKKCRQELKHQRVSEVIANAELRAAFRAYGLEVRLQEDDSSTSELKRLKRWEALMDRFESLVDRMEDIMSSEG